MSGQLAVVGLGPGDARYLTPEADDALAAAEALYGYGPYLDRVPARAGQSRHASDNREEARARRRRASPRRARRARRRRVRRRSRRLRHGGGDLRSRSKPGRKLGARSMLRSFPASPRCWPSRRGSARRSVTISARCRCPTISSRGNSSSAGSTRRRAPALSSRSTIRSRGRGRGNSATRSSGCAGICRQRRRSCSAAPSGGRMSASTSRRSTAADAAQADMATLVIVGSRETRVIARPGTFAAGLYAARRRRGERMIEPGERILDRLDRGAVGQPAAGAA